MTIDLSRAGILVAIVSLAGTGVTVIAKWIRVEGAVASHESAIGQMKDAYQKHDEELDVLHETLVGLRKDSEHTHRDIYLLRKELRMSDRGVALPALGKEDEE